MAIEKEFGSTYGGLRQDASMAGTTPSSAMESADATFAGDRDAQDINDDAIDTLNNLLETCRDGEFGFTESAEHTKTKKLLIAYLKVNILSAILM